MLYQMIFMQFLCTFSRKTMHRLVERQGVSYEFILEHFSLHLEQERYIKSVSVR